MVYLWLKSFHVLFIIAWMASVFYLPRILVNLAEAGEQPALKVRLLLMGRRLYRFGHYIFGLVFVTGMALWQGWRVFVSQLPDVTAGRYWIDAKLVLVALLLGYFIWAGRLLKRYETGGLLPSARVLRWLNELPLIPLLSLIFLGLAKPF